MKKIAILTAAGSGTRMGQDVPKQFLNVFDKPIIIYTMEAFQKHPGIDAIIVVCIEGWHEILKSYAKQFNITKLVSVVNGGKCGQESIKNGLDEAKRLFSNDDMVLIHDGVRPMVSEEIISDNIAKCALYGNAIATIPCTTVVLEKFAESTSTKFLDRDKLVLTQTPHAFILSDILSVHEEAKEKGIVNSVASCSLYVELGREVYFSAGSETNIKLTRPGDIQIFKALLATKENEWMK